MYSLCGCAYLRDNCGPLEYLPQVDLSVHSTILSSTSRTTLTQTFINPSKNESIEEVSYIFPMYDGVSVVAFSCHIGDRVLHGLVKERQQASTEYKEAVKSGQVAGLLEQMTDVSDVFRTNLGNIPADSKVVVAITYVGELQQDAQANGVRFTIPNAIAPRYGSVRDSGNCPSNTWSGLIQNGGLKITVDVTIEKGSAIRGLQSTSHPLAITLGRTSHMPESVFEPHQASANLSLRKGQVLLERDFVMVVNAEGQDQPVAFLETHPSIPNQRALMTSLVPKFGLPDNDPEIIFIIDRSGSMSRNIPTLQSALRVFLKSLPAGVTFNICSFGSSWSFMWERSKTIDAFCLEEALGYVNTIDSNMGGTEMYQAVEATLNNRFKDKELEVLLLTDGAIWDQESLFSLVNKASEENTVRFFSLGIGNGASSSLVEGIARAGNGFSQFVLEDEELDRKVIRMLKGALTPHIRDYSLEVEYAAENEDDFEMVDAANTIPIVQSTASVSGQSEHVQESQKTGEPISLFDNSYQEPELKTNNGQLSAADRFKGLPDIPVPKVLQAPTKITSLFPFIRSNTYLIFSPETAEKTPKTLVFRGTSKHGPLTLRIPIQDTGIGEMVHQLAAKKAVLELEEGRGWLLNAKTEDGKLVKDTYESKWENIVARECVRLGTKFQIAGRWCSFVALQDDNSKNDPNPRNQVHPTEQTNTRPAFRGGGPGHILSGGRGGAAAAAACYSAFPFGTVSFDPYMTGHLADTIGKTGQSMRLQPQMMARQAARLAIPTTFSAGGTYVPPQMRLAQAGYGSVRGGPENIGICPIAGFGQALFGSTSTSGRSLFSGAPPPHPSNSTSLFGSISTSSGLFGNSSASGSTSSVSSIFPSATLFGGSAPQSSSPHSSSLFGSASTPKPSLFSSPASSLPSPGNSAFGSASTSGSTGGLFSPTPLPCASGLFGCIPQSSLPPRDNSTTVDLTGDADEPRMRARRRMMASPNVMALTADIRQPDASPLFPAKRDADKVHQVIALQEFEGSWNWTVALLQILCLNAEHATAKIKEKFIAAAEKYGVENPQDEFTKDPTCRVLATLLVRMFLKEKASDRKETWELVDKKAESWIQQTLKDRVPETALFGDLRETMLSLF